MGKGNLYNDIHKGLYTSAIFEINEIKSKSPHLGKYCDLLIEILNQSIISKNRPLKRVINPLIDKILL